MTKKLTLDLSEAILTVAAIDIALRSPFIPADQRRLMEQQGRPIIDRFKKFIASQPK